MIGCVRGSEGRDFGEKEWFKKSLREEDEEEDKSTDGGECSCNCKCNIVLHLSASLSLIPKTPVGMVSHSHSQHKK